MKTIRFFFVNSFLPSIWISICPIILATTIAAADGIQNWIRAIISLIIAIILQTLLIVFSNKIGPTKFLRLKIFICAIILGPLLTSWSYYFQSQEINAAIVLAGIPLGLLTAIIVIFKEHRKLAADTLLLAYLWLTFSGCVMPLIIYGITNDNVYSLSACAILFMTIKPILKLSHKNAHDYADLIESTLHIAFIYTILFSVGWIL